MKVKDLLKALNKVTKDNPNAKNFEIIYASDDEGNSYHRIHNTPTLMQVEDVKEYYLEVIEDEVKNDENTVICIN